MYSWLVAFLFLICLQTPADASSTTPTPIDLIFDIDWTTFYSVDPSQKDPQTLMVEGKLYRPTDHLVEVLETLITKHPEIRISFFSGGDRSRNEALLKSLHLSDGRSLFAISYRVFSKEHLTTVSQDETLPFSSRYKKVIEGLIPHWNPAKTLLIDDQVEFARPPLRAVSSLGVFNFMQKYDPTLTSQKYFPPNQQIWKIERNKALLWLAMIEYSLEQANKKGLEFSALAQETWAHQSQGLLLNTTAPSCQNIFHF